MVSFQTDVYPILLANCGKTCHSTPDSSNGNVSFGSGFGYLGVYDELTTNTGNHAPDTTCTEDLIVNPDPTASLSLLYQKISGVGIPTGCGVQMPKGGPYLGAADQLTIKNWILDNEPL